MSFEEIEAMMAKEYKSEARQLQVLGIIETLRFDKHISDRDFSSPSAAVTEIIDLIERLTPLESSVRARIRSIISTRPS